MDFRLLKPLRWSPKEIDVGLPGIESYRNVTGTHLHIEAIARLILGRQVVVGSWLFTYPLVVSK